MKVSGALVAAALLLVACHKPAGADRAAASPVTASEPQILALDAAVQGTWAAYDNGSNEQLGDALIGKDFIRFDKSSLMRLVPVTALSADVTTAPAASLCGDRPTLFATFQIVDHPRPQSLKISVYDQPPEPTADPDFDPHRCQVFTYVRD